MPVCTVIAINIYLPTQGLAIYSSKMSIPNHAFFVLSAPSSRHLTRLDMIFFWICLLLVSTSLSASSQLANCADRQFEAGHVPGQMSVQEKKFRFRCLVQPALTAVYQELETQYQQVQKIID